MRSKNKLLLAGICATILGSDLGAAEESVELLLRYQAETELHSGRFHQLTRHERWNPSETAIIVCDVWDLHHCRNAVKRVEEFAPRLNAVLNDARSRGITVIHSPSDCMTAYAGHPARTRAVETPEPDFVPRECDEWCSKIPAEERAIYPIDQSDGGEDDDPAEHAEWVAQLKAMGRNPGAPWKMQAELIEIDPDRDFISDNGTEVWNVLQANGIRNVILTGVHTNMCVLGRPFGLRQMARNGMNVVLMRDMTDTMYNPQRWPYVSHFTGTDLIVSHIERYVCPTITSAQLIDGEPFRFADDKRPHLVMLIAEDEYRTQESLPVFASEQLGRDFRVTLLHGSTSVRDDIPGIEVIADADVLFVSVRRRVLPPAQLQYVRDHVAAGKPVIGIRTASHAFSLRNKKPPAGHVDWPEFDAQVFGGNYHGHHANDLKSTVRITNSDHPITEGLSPDVIPQGWSLYQTSPLADGTEVLTTGTIEGLPPEPVSWTFTRKDGGRSFYSSMGNVDDFRNPRFVKLLYRGICWAAGITSTEPRQHDGWTSLMIPPSSVSDKLRTQDAVWLRSAFRLPAEWTNANESFRLRVECNSHSLTAWVNGDEIPQLPRTSNDYREFRISSTRLYSGEANLLVLSGDAAWLTNMSSAPSITASGAKLTMRGKWQLRQGSDEHNADIPLPAKFGASADIVFSPDEPLWIARTLTPPNTFTPGIEGPACDRAGNILAVNYQKQGTIGRVSPDGSAEVYVSLPEGSIGNGIRFDRDGDFFVADYTGHNILKVDSKTREVQTLAHNSEMNQPNDLAIAPDGTLYASDPAWDAGTGQLWRIDTDGSITRLAENMGTTNGIEVSPDGTTLYVNESVQRNVWAFDITPARSLQNKRLIRQFPDHGFDGMRCDADGNLYIARYGAGSVVKMTPTGEILQKIRLPGARPSNVCFGGPDGCTVYVTLVDNACLVSFRVDRPGRSWGEMHAAR